MSDARSLAFAILLHVLALVIAAGAGLAGASALFADPGPSETALTRWGFTVGVHVLPPLFIGALLPRRWWLGVLCAWGAALIGALYLPEVLGLGLFGAVVAPLLCLVSAWTGGVLGRRARG